MISESNHFMMMLTTVTCTVLFQSVHQFPVQLQVLQWYDMLFVMGVGGGSQVQILKLNSHTCYYYIWMEFLVIGEDINYYTHTRLLVGIGLCKVTKLRMTCV